MKQIVKSGVTLTDPIKTRFEWVDEISDRGRPIYWLFLQTETFAGEYHQFFCTEERAARTQELYELHHYESCLHFAPAPGSYPPLCFDNFGPMDGFRDFQFVSEREVEDQDQWNN